MGDDSVALYPSPCSGTTSGAAIRQPTPTAVPLATQEHPSPPDLAVVEIDADDGVRAEFRGFGRQLAQAGLLGLPERLLKRSAAARDDVPDAVEQVPEHVGAQHTLRADKAEGLPGMVGKSCSWDRSGVKAIGNRPSPRLQSPCTSKTPSQTLVPARAPLRLRVQLREPPQPCARL